MSQENQERKCSLFEKVFYNLLHEDMSAGAGGVFGGGSSMGHGGAVGNSDFYAPGDARLPTILGSKKKRRKSKKKRKKTRKSKKKMEEDIVIPKTGIDTSVVQRRPAVGRM
jgi:hypothetical protein